MNDTEFYIGVAEAISSSLDIGEALERTFIFLGKVIHIDALSLFYFDFDKKSLFCLAEITSRGSVVCFENPINCGPPHPKHAIFSKPDFSYDSMILPEDDVLSYEEKEWFFKNSEVMRERYSKYLNGSALRLWLHLGKEMTGTLLVTSKIANLFDANMLRLFSLVRDPVTVAMSNARRYQELLLLKHQLEDDNKALHQELIRESGIQPVGANFGLREVMKNARLVASTNSPVIILGETGTGKEVIANTIHQLSDRRNKPMVKIQCGAIPESLLDSELFGHEKGAFTGAIVSHRGKFERADGGTIFLDEIRELTLNSQVKLLRVLQEKVIEKLGSTKTIHLDVRVIAATNRNLENMVKDLTFREDLWFRLNIFPIHLPPLRFRKEDIPALVRYFIDKKCHELNFSQIPVVTNEVMDHLLSYSWPGNIRELQNVIERALILNSGKYFTIPELFLTTDTASKHSAQNEFYQDEEVSDLTLDQIQIKHIRNTLARCNGIVSGNKGAARLLGINPNTLRARMKRLGINYGLKA